MSGWLSALEVHNMMDMFLAKLLVDSRIPHPVTHEQHIQHQINIFPDFKSLHDTARVLQHSAICLSFTY